MPLDHYAALGRSGLRVSPFTPYLDLCWMHNWDRNTPIEGTIRVLDDLVGSGKFRVMLPFAGTTVDERVVGGFVRPSCGAACGTEGGVCST